MGAFPGHDMVSATPHVTYRRGDEIIYHAMLAHYQNGDDTGLEYLFSSEKALGSLAENYVGLPF